MMKEPTDHQLLSRCKTEKDHAEHVVRLGLRIFDGAHGLLGIPPAERALLETACRLHDIGYSDDPGRHELASCRILINRGVAGLTAAQSRLAGAAILLHGGNRKSAMDHPVWKKIRSPKRAKQIASILRIADALDHTHIQDTVIEHVKWAGEAFEVRLENPGSPDNIPWAAKKADLWKETFEHEIVFTAGKRSRQGSLFAVVFRSEDTVLKSAQRLFCLQYRLMSDARKAILKDSHEKDEALHDFRVAVNRFRAMLRVCRPFISDIYSKELRQALSGFRRTLGPARDSEIWIACLKRFEKDRNCAENAAWTNFLSAQQRQDESLRKDMANKLEGREYAEFKERITAFLRRDLPGLVHSSPGGDYANYMRDRLNRKSAKLMKRKVKPGRMSSDEMHRLRKRCKRLRYAAEFAAPALGSNTAELAGKLKAVTGSLGDVHDMDVCLIHAESLQSSDGYTRLPDFIRHERDSALKDFRKSWSSLIRFLE